MQQMATMMMNAAIEHKNDWSAKKHDKDTHGSDINNHSNNCNNYSPRKNAWTPPPTRQNTNYYGWPQKQQ